MTCLVLDASAVIHGRDVRIFGGVLYTTREVIEELRDSRAQAAIDILRVEVVEVNRERVRDLAKRFNLSNADASVLALALEKKCVLVTDDGKLASTARKLGVKTRGIYMRE